MLKLAFKKRNITTGISKEMILKTRVCLNANLVKLKFYDKKLEEN